MLVLGGKVNERFLIDGGRISVRVVSTAGRRVRLGFEAPRDVLVMRETVQRRIDEVRLRIEQGEPLSSIEQNLDLRENQTEG